MKAQLKVKEKKTTNSYKLKRNKTFEGMTTEQNESDKDLENYLDKKRGFETAFSATSPSRVIEIFKEKRQD